MTAKPDPVKAFGTLMVLIPAVLILGALLLAFLDVVWGRTGLIVGGVAILWAAGWIWRRAD